MRVFEVHQSEIKQITLFLIKAKVLFHPRISPDGSPNFTDYGNRKVAIILDRNLLVYLLSLLRNGHIKDGFIRKLIGSLMFWVEFNGFSLTSGLALAEYASFNNDNSPANKEHNIFNQLFIEYSPKNWLDLAVGRLETLPKADKRVKTENNFNVESSQFKMHYIEMLKLAQLFYNEKIAIVEKFEDFFRWTYQNLIICRYTTCLSAKILSGNSKAFKLARLSFSELNRRCINQAWDLTYLSTWSSLYWTDQNSDIIFLFATADKELKEIFTLTNKYPQKIFSTYFEKQKALQIQQIMQSCYLPRERRDIDVKTLNRRIDIEMKNLEKQINIKYGL